MNNYISIKEARDTFEGRVPTKGTLIKAIKSDALKATMFGGVYAIWRPSLND